MPELPEVTTTVKGLQKILPGLVIKDLWSDLPKANQKVKHFKDTLKDKKFFEFFKEKTINQKVLGVSRRGKNILIEISGGWTILIHLKMTGHLLYGQYQKKMKGKEIHWKPLDPLSPLNDPFNRFIHLVFFLNNDYQLAFCDARKFGKVTLIKTSEIPSSKHLKNLGPEPLEKKTTLKVFKDRLLLRPRKKIKEVLMDQSIIVGIGNIYAGEILWLSGIHPDSIVEKIPKGKMEEMFEATKTMLQKGIKLEGDSTSNYRNVYGLKGKFQLHHFAYRLAGTRCQKKNCKGVIIRKTIGGRGTYFCNYHQKLFE